MARDNQNKLSKKEQIKRSKRDDEKLLINNKKKNEESDGDNGEDENGDEMFMNTANFYLKKIPLSI